MNKIFLIFAALLMLLPFHSNPSPCTITEDELKIFSCLYMAQNVVSEMSQFEYVDIANAQPISLVSSETGWGWSEWKTTGEWEPIYDIYFTEHILLSFWGEPISQLQLNTDDIFIPSPIVRLSIQEKADFFPFPVIDENAIISDTYLEDAAIHNKNVLCTISQAEYELLSVYLSCAHLRPDISSEAFIKILIENEIPFEKYESFQQDGKDMTVISYSDKLSLTLVSDGNIEAAYIGFQYFDGKEEYCVNVPAQIEDTYFQHFDTL